MQLTTQNVAAIFMDCLFNEGEDTANMVRVTGIIRDMGFNPERLAKHKESIKELLAELPDTFKQGSGDGDSFLNMCMDKHGNYWGEHQNMEQLVCLGLATDLANYPISKQYWKALPGQMPYVSLSL